MSEPKDLIGQRYGKLTAIKPDGRETPTKGKRTGQLKYLWKCDCGNFISARTSAVTCGNTKSCGCNHIGQITHGATMGKHRTGKTLRSYTIWADMRRRCNKPSDKSYPNYGGRGIHVCERWCKYENFVSDMGEPALNMSIDRVDNDKGYSLENCKWSTTKEQNNNRRDNVIVPDNGIDYTFAQFAHKYSLKYKWLHSWKQRGIDVVHFVHAIRAVAIKLHLKELIA